MALRTRLIAACGGLAALVAAAASDAPLWAAMPPALLAQRLPVNDSASWGWHAEARRFEAADAVPVRRFDGDWGRYTPRAGRNTALQRAQVEAGVSHAGWDFSALVRSELLLTGSRGAFDAVHLYKQRLSPADGTVLVVQADETAAVLAGLRGARSWVLGSGDAWRFTAAFSLLSVRRVQAQSALGEVRYDTAAGYTFDASTLQQDSHRQFGGYGQRRPGGWGQALDLGLLWQPTPRSFVNLSATDLGARLHVKAVSVQETNLSSSTRSYDANGYLAYRPLLSGRYAAADVALRLPTTWAASAGACTPAGSGEACGGLRWERTASVDLPALWLALQPVPGWRVQGEVETRYRSLGLGLAWRGLALTLRTRSLPAGESRALGWQLSYSASP